MDTVINGKKILQPQRSISGSLPEGYQLLRQLLASQKDASVVLIAVGPVTNLARLLDSQPDNYSKLSGKDLVAQKVKLLSIMGGLYSDEFDFPEWNIVQDLKAAQKVFSEWPPEIVASGLEIGNKLLYPHQSILNDFRSDHPLSVSYKIFDQMPYDRQTWDLTSVLYAIEPDKGYFNLSSKGAISIDSTSKSIFTAKEDGKHRYLLIEKDKVADTLKAIVDKVIGK